MARRFSVSSAAPCRTRVALFSPATRASRASLGLHTLPTVCSTTLSVEHVVRMPRGTSRGVNNETGSLLRLTRARCQSRHHGEREAAEGGTAAHDGHAHDSSCGRADARRSRSACTRCRVGVKGGRASEGDGRRRARKEPSRVNVGCEVARSHRRWLSWLVDRAAARSSFWAAVGKKRASSRARGEHSGRRSISRHETSDPIARSTRAITSRRWSRACASRRDGPVGRRRTARHRDQTRRHGDRERARGGCAVAGRPRDTRHARAKGRMGWQKTIAIASCAALGTERAPNSNASWQKTIAIASCAA